MGNTIHGAVKIYISVAFVKLLIRIAANISYIANCRQFVSSNYRDFWYADHFIDD